MAMTALTSHAIECDACGDQAPRTLTQVDAARYALACGWLTALDGDDPGEDLCPACLKDEVER